MGNTLPTSLQQTQDLRNVLQRDAPQFVYVDLIGRGKFVKSMHCRHVPRDATGKASPGESSIAVPGQVVVKVYFKRGDKSQVQREQLAKLQLTQLCSMFNLRDQPNIVPYQRFEESTRSDCAYLVRQYFAYNLYDRLNSRPFVGRVEKLWLMYQLLQAAQQAHAAGVRHGDIKAENVLVTSWGWLMLTDFGTFKPTYLAEDAPADFLFFFDSTSSARPRCCLSPERLVKQKDLAAMRALSDVSVEGSSALSNGGTSIAEGGGSKGGVPPSDPALQESMDMFSLGCTLAEIVNDGEPLFDFGSLLAYGAGNSANAASSGSSSVPASSQGGQSSTAATTPASIAAGAAADPLSSPYTASSLAYLDPAGTALKPMLMSMIDLNPAKRGRAAQHLETHTSRGSVAALVPLAPPASGALTLPIDKPLPLPSASDSSRQDKLFPAFFPYMHTIMARLIQPDFSVPGPTSGGLGAADMRVLAVAACYSDLLLHVTGGAVDPVGDALLRWRMKGEGFRGEAARKLLAELIAPQTASLASTARSVARSSLHQSAGESWADHSVSTPAGSAAGKHRRKSSIHVPPNGKPRSMDRKRYGVAANATISALQDLTWDWYMQEAGSTDAPSFSVGNWTQDCDVELIADDSDRARLLCSTEDGLCAVHDRWQPYRWAWVLLEEQSLPAASVAPPALPVSSGAGSTSSSTGTEEGPKAVDARAGRSREGRQGSIIRKSSEATAAPIDTVASRPASAAALSHMTEHAVSALKERSEHITEQAATMSSLLEQPVDEPLPAAAVTPGPRHTKLVPALRLVRADPSTLHGDNLAMLLALLTASLRFIASPRTKVTALLLLSRLSAWADDDTRLQRVVPYITTQLNDPSAQVRAHALAALVAVLEPLSAHPEEELSLSAVFPQYILPMVARVASDPEPIVQMASAECMPRFVILAQRYLEVGTWEAQLAGMRRLAAAAAKAGSAGVNGILSPTPSRPEMNDADPSAPDPSVSEGFLSPTGQEVWAGAGASAVNLADPTQSILAAAKLKSTYDSERFALRRRIHSVLSKWLSSATEESAAAATELVLSSGSATRWLVENARDGDDMDADPAAFISFLQSDRMFSVSTLAGIARAVAVLPCSAEISLLRRALMGTGNMEALAAFYGPDGTQESLLPLFLTFLVDPAATSVLNTLSSVPSLLSSLMPAAAHPLAAAGAVAPGQTLSASWLSYPVLNQPLVSMLLSWLARGSIGGGDWLGLSAFIDRIVRLAVQQGGDVGRVTVLPFLEQLLVSPQETVGHAVLLAFAQLFRFNLLHVGTTAFSNTLARCVPLLVHPSPWIRAGAKAAVAASWCRLGWPRAYVDTAGGFVGLNRVLDHAAGELMWTQVQRTLSAGAAHEGRKSARATMHAPEQEQHLQGILERCVTAPLSRHTFDLAAHDAALARMKRVSFGLEARLSAFADGLHLRGSGATMAASSTEEEVAGSLTSPVPAARDFNAFVGGDSLDSQKVAVPIGASEQTTALLRSLPAKGGEQSSSVAALTAPGLYSSVMPYAGPFATTEDRERYLTGLLSDVLASNAGPYRLSPTTAARIVDASVRIESSAQQSAQLSASASASSVPRTVPSPDQARVLLSIAGAMGAEVPAAVVEVAGAGLQARASPPYTDEEMAALSSKVRTISFPDQRFTALHPQPPAAAVAVAPSPQNEILPSQVQPGDDDGTSSSGPAGPSRRLSMSSPGRGDDEHVSVHTALASEWANVDAETFVASNAPLPEDCQHYLAAIMQGVRNHVRSRTSKASGPLLASPPERRGRSRGSSFSVGLMPAPSLQQNSTGSVSPTLRAGRQNSSSSRLNSFVSFALALERGQGAAGGAATPGTAASNTSLVLQAVPRPLSANYSSFTAVGVAPAGSKSHILLSLRFRKEWRAAGRAARKLHLQHGLWSPLLGTDVSAVAGVAAANTAPGTATAFFYGMGGSKPSASAADDPGLYESDEESTVSARGNTRGGYYGSRKSMHAYGSSAGEDEQGSVITEGERGREGFGYAGYADAATTDPTQASYTTGEGDDRDRRTNSMEEAFPTGLSFDGPEVLVPPGGGDARVSQSAMAARFSAAAHTAITLTDAASSLRTAGAGPPQAAARSRTGAADARTAAQSVASRGGQVDAIFTGRASRGKDASFVSSVYEAEQAVTKSGLLRRTAQNSAALKRSNTGLGAVAVPGSAITVSDVGAGSTLSVLGQGSMIAVSEGDTAASSTDPAAAPAGAIVIDPTYMAEPVDSGSGVSIVEPQKERRPSLARKDSGRSKENARKATSAVSFNTAGNSAPLVRSKSLASSQEISSTPGGITRVGSDGGVLDRRAAGKSFARGGDERDFLAPIAAEALARRVRALQIPPLPPNLGFLQKPGGDPALPVCAHAARVATGVPVHAWSSAAVGVGSGVLIPGDGKASGTFPSASVRIVSDENPRLGITPEAGDELLVRGLLAGIGVPGQVPAAASSTEGRPLSSTFSASTGTGALAVPDVQASPVSLTSSVSVALASSMGLPPSGKLRLVDEIATSLVPVALPAPERTDLSRPYDVGDGSGYVGSGRVSFLGVEAGWHDGVGVGAPPGTALAGTIGIVPSSAGSGSRENGTYSVSAQAGSVESGPVGAGSVSGSGAGATAQSGGAAAPPGWDGGAGTWGSRPRGLLLSTLDEHSASITALAVCGDHSFFVSGAEDGLVKVWSTRGLDRDVAPSSVMTYSAHTQEAAADEFERRGFASSGARIPAVTDVTVLDNSCSVASGSSAGSVHVWRVNIAAASAKGSQGVTGRPAGTRDESGSVASGGTGSFAGNGGLGTYIGRQTHTNSLALPRFSSRTDRVIPGLGYGEGQERDDSDWGGAGGYGYIRTPDGAALVRRLVYPASEGSVVSLKHYETHASSMLCVGMAAGLVHGVDLRDRAEAWCWTLPPELGCITCMEVCPGSTAVVLGTDRGVIALYDTRAHLCISAWRHSARAPVTAVYPYVSLRVRSARLEPGSSTLGECRRLCVGVACGPDGDVSFFDMETGECTRILRTLPRTVSRSDAFNPPFLLPIVIIAGRVRPSPGMFSLVEAGQDLKQRIRGRGVRSILCPLPTSVISGLGAAGAVGGTSGPDDGLGPGADTGEFAGGPGAPGTGAGGAPLAPNAGLGFVLGGIRGAGAARRSRPGFEYGYTVGPGVGSDVLVGSTVGMGMSSGPTSASVAMTGAATPYARCGRELYDPASDNASSLLATTGCGPGEGLPVWLLTAGSDACVRCWDMDRPRASHTVCGLPPVEPRDAYEGAWILPESPQWWDVQDIPGGVPAGSSPLAGGHLPAAQGAKGSHFMQSAEQDGMSAGRPISNEPALKGLGLAGHSSLPGVAYKYWNQRGTPIRTTLCQGLATPLADDDTAALSMSESPYRRGKGPVPAPAMHTAPITAMAWVDLPLRLLLTGSKDGLVKVWR